VTRILLSVIAMILFIELSPRVEARDRWTAPEATAWYQRQPWLVGVNYIPATAVNTLEMWQAETFDPVTIDTELGWAQSAGINSIRVFLHHLLWEQDADGYKKRIDRLLGIAHGHGIKVMLVLFDSCFDPEPHLGPQSPPMPGVFTTRWVQGPGRDRLEDASHYPQLEHYVHDVVSSFAKDPRILAWDVWNEPPPRAEPLSLQHPPPPGSPAALLRMEERDSPNKSELTRRLLEKAFAWARAANPTQPLTSGIFDATHTWAPPDLTPVERLQIENSDVISFHSYSPPKVFEQQAQFLKGYGRPVLCTEYLSRPDGSTVEAILPLGKRLDIGMFNWGLVDGRMQTKFPFDSWLKPYTGEPPLWKHDLLHSDGTPYRMHEVKLIETLSSAPRHTVPKTEKPQ